jgi:hypothetical protein
MDIDVCHESVLLSFSLGMILYYSENEKTLILILKEKALGRKKAWIHF